MPKLSSNKRFVFVVSLLAIFVLGFFMKPGEGGVVISSGEESLSVSCPGTATVDIEYADILGVSEVDGLDLGDPVDGARGKRLSYGTWKNGEFGEYRLFAYSRVARYIVISHAGGVVVLNYEDAVSTDSLYEAIGRQVEKRRGR